MSLKPYKFDPSLVDELGSTEAAMVVSFLRHIGAVRAWHVDTPTSWAQRIGIRVSQLSKARKLLEEREIIAQHHKGSQLSMALT